MGCAKVHKGRIDGETFTISDDEAKLAQDLALKHRQQWNGRLQAALKNPAEFAKVEAEIAALRAGYDKPELVGMSAKGIEAYTKEFRAAVSADGISEHKIQNMREQSASLKEFGKLAGKLLKAPQDKEVRKACMQFWTESNGKLRDDVLFEAMLHEARVTVAGNRDEADRMKQVVGAVNEILNLGGFRMIYDKLPEDARAGFLSKQNGPGKRFAPKLAAALAAAPSTPQRFFQLCDLYMLVWSDVNLMDKLKEQQFATEVFLEADTEFAKAMESAR